MERREEREKERRIEWKQARWGGKKQQKGAMNEWKKEGKERKE